MKKITTFSLILLMALFSQSIKAEIYYDFTGTVTLGYTEVSTEQAKPQADRWITTTSFPSSNTSGRCSSVASSFNMTNTRTIEFWLNKCDNITINANIASGRGATVSVDGVLVYTINGTGTCGDFSYNVNKEVPCKIKVTGLFSTSAYISLFKFTYAPKIPTITSFIAEGVSATINQNSTPKTAIANLPFGTNLAAITPVVTIGGIATSYSPSGVQDFSNSATIPIVYTATDGTNNTNYSVTLTANKNTEKTLNNLKIGGLTPIFNTTTNTYSLILPKGSSLNQAVTFDLPFRATTDFTTGTSNDFTNPLAITVTAEDGSTQAYTLNVIAAIKNIAYIINTAVDAKDIKIRPKLASLYYIDNILIANITTTYDFSMYDLVVQTEVPSSGSAGMKALWGINKPLLQLKMFAIQANTWNLSTASNPAPSITTVAVNEPNHPLFSGLTMTGTFGNELQVFNPITTGNGVQTSPYAGNYNLASIKGAITPGILELPVGTTSPMTGTTNAALQSKLLILSISNDNQNIVTNDALTLIQNACNYLMGSSSWGTDAGTMFKDVTPSASLYSVTRTTATIQWSAEPGAVKYFIEQTLPVPPTSAPSVNRVVAAATEVPGNVLQLEVTGITQSTHYTFTVTAQNAAGVNSKAGSMSFDSWFTGLSSTQLQGVTFDGRTIHNADNKVLNVFDATGRLVVSATKNIDMSSHAKGIYIVKGENGLLKIALTR